MLYLSLSIAMKILRSTCPTLIHIMDPTTGICLFNSIIYSHPYYTIYTYRYVTFSNLIYFFIYLMNKKKIVAAEILKLENELKGLVYKAVQIYLLILVKS